jgi:hypothetical protein
VADSDTGVADVVKVLSGALATVIATAATIGTVTGGLAFLLRNAP